ncbi:RIP metalloprotease RseP [Rummeliibacillus suwonensis]|uniref:RIP metalloprotease RseP n=1 Tax=Rummeliibacillus suwonensis TaxID=1306154 RepID=UPI0011B418A9|nr:RIP metalloprotease RseP [Rummeliibacillus suwonensis]MBO2534609.1 RIP metalloprotease RseP [Rummeliibacillus suwonensis]
MQSIIAFIIVFGSIVFFHELGHFIFAKRSGILVREFAIGFGPKILGINKGETLYTIRLLPMGGYVRMAGDDADVVELQPGYRIGMLLNDQNEVAKIVLNQNKQLPDMLFLEVEKADLQKKLWIEGYDEDEKLVRYNIARNAVIEENGSELMIAPYDRQFNSKSVGKRAMTIFAGPLFNFILAIIVFIVIAFMAGVPTYEPVLAGVVKDSPAAAAGLEKGDYVTAIDGKSIETWQELSTAIQNNPNKELTLDIKRDDGHEKVKVTPSEKKIDGQTIGQIGVQYQSPVEKSPLKALAFGFTETYHWTIKIFTILGALITGGFTIDALSGPVGIYKATEEVAKYGAINIMNWAAVLSINLGIMNLLPLPALDGGRLLFFGFEAVRGKPVDRQKEGMVHFVGIVLLMILMIAVTWNDIQRFFF